MSGYYRFLIVPYRGDHSFSAAPGELGSGGVGSGAILESPWTELPLRAHRTERWAHSLVPAEVRYQLRAGLTQYLSEKPSDQTSGRTSERTGSY